MRCGKPEHQLGQKCPAKNAKCKDCQKKGHFHKVCQSNKRGKRANLVQTPPQDEDDTHINENGVRQPNPPRVNMLKIVNHILYAPTRYKILETQLQTFQYWDSSIPTCSLGVKSTFIVTNANDCPSVLSYGATFRMSVLLPNYPEENVVRGENVPNFKVNTSEGTSSNVFQILQDL